MTLSEFFKIHRLAGLEALANKAGTEVNYLRQLIYNPERIPSTRLALRLVKASGGVLSLDGLAHPKRQLICPPLRKDDRRLRGNRGSERAE